MSDLWNSDKDAKHHEEGSKRLYASIDVKQRASEIEAKMSSATAKPQLTVAAAAPSKPQPKSTMPLLARASDDEHKKSPREFRYKDSTDWFAKT
jgi:hypothetical protein